MDLEKIVRDRKQEAHRMRRVLAEWISEGVPRRQMLREWERLRRFEAATERMECLLTPDDRPLGMFQIGFVREGESH